MTEALYRKNAYLKEAEGVVLSHGVNGGIVLDRSVFYPLGGGQPADTGFIVWNGSRIRVENAVNAGLENIELILGQGESLPAIGDGVLQKIDWERRYKHMRVHTALHLLSALVALPVSGGSIGDGKGRLDFDMPDALEDRDGLEEKLNRHIASDLNVSEQWITDRELDEQPDLVRTMAVKPPRGKGRVRLVKIGAGNDVVDLQPCGGTHVRSTNEIGRLRLGKVEKKGRRNRRINILLDQV